MLSLHYIYTEESELTLVARQQHYHSSKTIPLKHKQPTSLLFTTLFWGTKRTHFTVDIRCAAWTHNNTGLSSDIVCCLWWRRISFLLKEPWSKLFANIQNKQPCPQHTRDPCDKRQGVCHVTSQRIMFIMGSALLRAVCRRCTSILFNCYLKRLKIHRIVNLTNT